MKISKLELVRREKGISQRVLAEKVGCKQPSLSYIERGMYAPTELLGKLAKELEVEVSDITGSIDIDLATDKSTLEAA